MSTLWKTLHIAGACLFIGNIVVSAVWKTLADRTHSLDVARFATRLINLTDAVFTAGGATLLVVAGHVLAGGHGGIAPHPWIVWSYVAFGVSGLIWLTVLLPIQIRQAWLLKHATQSIPADYHRLARWWAVAGVAATVAALPPLHWMVSRTV